MDVLGFLEFIGKHYEIFVLSSFFLITGFISWGVFPKKPVDQDVDKSVPERKEYLLPLLFVFLAIVVVIVIMAYLQIFAGRKFSSESGAWGEVGDFFGGVLNPIFAFASFIALLYTIRIQSRELKLTTEELKRTATAQVEASGSLKRQNFENTFFKLLETLKNTSNDFPFTDTQCSYICYPSSNYSAPDIFDTDYNSSDYEYPDDMDTCKWQLAQDQINEAHKDFERLVRLCYYSLQYLLENGPYPSPGGRDTFICDAQSLYVNLILNMLDKNQLKMILIFCAKRPEYDKERNVFDFYHFFYLSGISFDSAVGEGLKVSESEFRKKAFTKDLN